MTEATGQERQQGFLADFNAWHEVAKRQYGYALTVVPAPQVVQTGEGPRIEIGLKFGLLEIAGWKGERHPPEGAGQRAPTEDAADVIAEGGG